MRLVLRIVGTWFFGLAVVLLIVDGAKSLANGTITTTSLAEMWHNLHDQSWAFVNEYIVQFAGSPLAQDISHYAFDWPSWASFGVLSLLFLVLGRRKRAKEYLASY